MDKEGRGVVSPSESLDQTRSGTGDDGIPQASITGLHTAYSLLQKQHRDSVKRNHELSNRVRLLEKLLTVDGKQVGEREMAEYITSNGDIVGAGSGASNEDDTVAAELRAKQGYISHLEKEVLRNNNMIARGNEEIQRLKQRCDEATREVLKVQRDLEHVRSDFEAVTETLAKEREISSKKDAEIQRLKSSNDGEHESLVSQISTLTEKLHVYERGSITNRDAETISNLNSRLTVADNEMKKLMVQYRELNEKLKTKDNEVKVLETRCRQYEIHVEINKGHSSRGTADNGDEVDGDLVVLGRLLQKVADQKTELDAMRIQMQEQNQLIKTITESKPSIEDRGCAVGDSFHYFGDPDKGYNHGYIYGEDKPPSPLSHFTTVQAVRVSQGASHSPLTRRRSDRSDNRSPIKGQITSPRIADAVKPTGNRSIHSMVASEMPAKTVTAASVFDSCVDRSRSPRLSDNVSNTSPVVSESTAHRRRDSGEYYNTSPRTINDQPSPVTELPQCDILGSRQSGRLFYTGTRQTANTNYLNLQCEEQNEYKPSASHRIPDRMTQSEIHSREMPEANLDLTKYAQPLQPLLIPTDFSTKHGMNNLTEHMYANTPPVKSAPNYENITQFPASGVRQATENEDDDDMFGECSPPFNQHYRNMSPHRASATEPMQEGAGARPVRAGSSQSTHADPGLDEISAVKICPACNKEFSRLTMDEFQAHVYDCFDNGEEGPATIQAAEEDDRVCPMCSATFPMTVAQEIYEQHVFAHFGEEAMMDGFEMLT